MSQTHMSHMWNIFTIRSREDQLPFCFFMLKYCAARPSPRKLQPIDFVKLARFYCCVGNYPLWYVWILPKYLKCLSPLKCRLRFAIGFYNSTPVYMCKRNNTTGLYKDVWTNVHTSIIPNSSNGRKFETLIIVNGIKYPYNRVLLRNKNKCSNIHCTVQLNLEYIVVNERN